MVWYHLEACSGLGPWGGGAPRPFLRQPVYSHAWRTVLRLLLPRLRPRNGLGWVISALFLAVKACWDHLTDTDIPLLVSLEGKPGPPTYPTGWGPVAPQEVLGASLVGESAIGLPA